jgi:molybdenum cofactor cytidylyltransferase
MMEDDPSLPRIVVLAAGFSSRMGRSKPLVTVRGVSLIRRTVAVLAPFTTGRIVVVTSPRALQLRAALQGCRVTILENPLRACGLSSSVIRGLRETRHSAATLLLPVDLGELTPRDIRRLISRWRAARRRVAACRLGSRASTPLILPKWLYPRALELVGDVGLRELIASLSPAQRVLVELPSAVRDIDTPRELAAARRAPGAFIRAGRSLAIYG